MGLLDSQSEQQYYDGNNFGGYQFVSLDNIISAFKFIYVGEGKIIPKIKRTDIAFHAQRALAELSFDTFKSIKSQEITLPPSNTMMLPQDYVNYTKVCWVDGNGIERPLYPTKHTSNPTPILQNSDGDYKLTAVGTLDDTTGIVELTGGHTNIEVGMIVTGPYIPNDNSNGLAGNAAADNMATTVVATSNLNGVTTITLGYTDMTGTQVEVFPIESNSNTTLTFSSIFGDLIVPKTTTFAVENLSWGVTDQKIIASAAVDIASVKVGMIISHDNFRIGTTVTNVSGTTIVVSNTPDLAVASGGEVTFIGEKSDSTTWGSYTSDTSNSTGDAHGYNHDTDIYDLNLGQRYGVEPSMAQGNGTYYVDELKGLIHFSSNVSGKTVILKYISDGLGSDGEMVVHKFAEEAMYKCIAYAILSTTISGQQLVPRFKKEKFAAVRQAKLRLSNIKIEELTQLMRGKSKWIKH
tara:strand:+ start:848 stop:2242 length:1395 start_codon:yes stop_codon:yes gene_type:complete